MSAINIIKRDQSVSSWDIQKIKKTASWATEDIEGVDSLELERSLHLSVRNDMTSVEVINEMINVGLSKISLDEPNWSHVAGRLALMNLNKEVRHNIATMKDREVRRKFGYGEFSKYLLWAESVGVYKNISSNYTEEELNEINGWINPLRDLDFHYSTVVSMQKSYLQRKNGKLVELPQEMYMAIAMTLAPHVSTNSTEKMQNVKDFYDEMSSFRLSPATPVVHNVRTLDGSGMSCAVTSFGDSLNQFDHAIVQIKKEASKGTGWGAYVGKLRAHGSWVKGHPNTAGGTIPMISQINSAIVSVDQLGQRDSNIALYQDIWHADLLDFLELKTENGDIHTKAYDIFLGVCINDEFFRRRETNADWTLIDPYEAKKILGKDLCDFFGDEWVEKYEILENSDLQIRKTIGANDLWKLLIKTIAETGDPYFFNRDVVASKNNNPNYPIYCSNLCVTGDTRLHTQYGMITAKELYDSKAPIIATVDNRTDGDWTQFGIRKEECIPMHMTAQNTDVYELTTNMGYKIKATAWHEFYVREQDKSIVKKKLSDLKEGDILLTQSAEGQWGTTGSYEEGLIMGFVAGDGTYGKRNDSGSSMCIDIYDKDIDTEVEDQIVGALTTIRCLVGKPSIQKFGKLMHKPSAKTDKTFTKKRIGASVIGKYLKYKYNFYGETKLVVPEGVFSGTKETVTGYLKGLFSADGTVNVSKTNLAIVLVLKQKKTLEDVQILLSNFGIRSQVSPLNRGTKDNFTYTKTNGDLMTYSTSPEMWRLSINKYEAKKFMDQIGFLNQYKNDRFKKAWDTWVSINSDLKKCGNNNPNRKFTTHTATIKSIIYVGKEDVYDTTQHNNHSLIFNGLVTGNCSEVLSHFFEDSESIKVISKDGTIELTSRVLGYTTTCNLASINLGMVDLNNSLQTEKTARIAIKLIDAVISENSVASASAERFNKDFRSAGAGYIGYHHFLAKNKLNYGSADALRVTDSLLEEIAYNVIDESMKLAVSFGAYSKFAESNFAKGIFFGRKAEEMGERWIALAEKVICNGVRNGYMFAIAPNTSTSLLIGESPSIYPVPDKLTLKDGYSGTYLVPAPELDKLNMWYKPAHVVTYIEYFDTVATFQHWVDQGISAQTYFDPNTQDAFNLHTMYMYALVEKKAKTTYYIRQKPTTCFSCAN